MPDETLSAVRLIVPVGAIEVRCGFLIPVVWILCCTCGGSCMMNCPVSIGSQSQSGNGPFFASSALSS